MHLLSLSLSSTHIPIHPFTPCPSLYKNINARGKGLGVAINCVKHFPSVFYQSAWGFTVTDMIVYTKRAYLKSSFMA